MLMKLGNNDFSKQAYSCPSVKNPVARNAIASKHFVCIKKGTTFVIPYQRYKDSNLEMTESESVALPFGDTAIFSAFRQGTCVLYKS